MIYSHIRQLHLFVMRNKKIKASKLLLHLKVCCYNNHLTGIFLFSFFQRLLFQFQSRQGDILQKNFHHRENTIEEKFPTVIPIDRTCNLKKKIKIKMKSKKYHTVKTVPNSYRKILEKSKIDTSDMQIHDPHFPGLVQALQ